MSVFDFENCGIEVNCHSSPIFFHQNMILGHLHDEKDFHHDSLQFSQHVKCFPKIMFIWAVQNQAVVFVLNSISAAILNCVHKVAALMANYMVATMLYCIINSLRPSDAYMLLYSNHHWFRWWLVVRLAQSHYLNLCWNIVNLTLRNKLQWNFNNDSDIFKQENAFESVISEMAAIFSWPQCVEVLWPFGGHVAFGQHWFS